MAAAAAASPTIPSYPPPPTALIAVPIKSKKSRARSHSNLNKSSSMAPEVRPPTTAATTPTSHYSSNHHYYPTPASLPTPLQRAGRVASLPPIRTNVLGSHPHGTHYPAPIAAAPPPRSGTPKGKMGNGGFKEGGGGHHGGGSSGGSVLVLHGKVHNYVSDSSSVSMASSNGGSEDSLEKVMGGHAAANSSDKQQHQLQPPEPSGRSQLQPSLLSARSRSLPATTYPPIPLHLVTPSHYPHQHQQHNSSGASTTTVVAVSSALQQLAFELQQFQSLIGDLQGMMLMLGQQQQSPESIMSIPEAGWRTRILVRSAQEADNDLWRKLYEVEQTVLAMKGEADMAHDDGPAAPSRQHRKLMVQEAQARCLELHRHFKHLHKTLLCTLEAHEHSQRAAVAQNLHTAAVLMMNPATGTTTNPSGPSVLLTPTRGLPPGAVYSPPLSPAPYGMMSMASPPMSPSSHAFSAPVPGMMMTTTPLGPPPTSMEDYFDRVTRQAERERSAPPGMMGAAAAAAAFRPVSAAMTTTGETPYGGSPLFASAPAGAQANANAPVGTSGEARPSGVWASRHCTEDGPMSSWGRYVNQAAPGLCGSLESLGDPRLWNFGGIEALDLVYKASDMELSKGSAADRPPAPSGKRPGDQDTDHDSVEMISPASEAIEVERILTEEKDAVLGVTSSSSSVGGFVSRVPSIVKSFTDASMGAALPSVAPASCGPSGACSGGDDGGGALLGCIHKRSDSEVQGKDGEGGDANGALNCGALQGVDLDEIQRNLVQLGRNVMSSVAESARGGDSHEDGRGAGTRAHRRGDTEHEDYDGDDDHEDDDDDDDDDDDYDEMASHEA